VRATLTNTLIPLKILSDHAPEVSEAFCETFCAQAIVNWENYKYLIFSYYISYIIILLYIMFLYIM